MALTLFSSSRFEAALKQGAIADEDARRLISEHRSRTGTNSPLLQLENMKGSELWQAATQAAAFLVAQASLEVIRGEESDFAVPLPHPELHVPVLSVLNLFRQHFYVLQERLGPPEQALTIAPFETVEVIQQTVTRTTFEESQESSSSSATESSSEVRTSDEITDRIQNSIERSRTDSTSLSASASGSYGVVSGSVNFNQSSSVTGVRKASTEQVSKHLTEVTNRNAEKISKSLSVRIKSTREFTESNSYRRLIQNSTEIPVNYLLRRVLCRYNVRIQDLGPRMCWQVFISDPGQSLGRARFISASYAPDWKYGMLFGEPQIPIVLPSREANVSMREPTGVRLEWQLPVESQQSLHQITFSNQQRSKMVRIAHSSGVNSYQVLIENVHIQVIDGTTDEQMLVLLTIAVFPDAANVGPDQERLVFDDVVAWHPSPVESELRTVTDDARTALLAEMSEWLGVQRTVLREKDSVKKRPPADLRREERHELMRLVRKNELGIVPSSNLDKVEIESFERLFDLEAMFFYAHPSWALPRSHMAYSYEVSEETAPRPFGASLGWLMQLDADERRNELINSPLARVCIPVRPGFEAYAAAYLAQKGAVVGDPAAIRDMLKEFSSIRAAEEALGTQGPDDTLGGEDRVYPVVKEFEVDVPVPGFVFTLLA